MRFICESYLRKSKKECSKKFFFKELNYAIDNFNLFPFSIYKEEDAYVELLIGKYCKKYTVDVDSIMTFKKVILIYKKNRSKYLWLN